MKLRISAMLLLLTSFAAAKDQPKTTPELTDVHKYQLIVKYAKAMEMQAQFQASVSAFQALQKAFLVEDGFPEPCISPKTTDCSNLAVDVPAETVTVTVVPPAAAKSATPAPTPAPTTNNSDLKK